MGEIQDRVGATVDELIASGREVGVQVAAYLHGEHGYHAWTFGWLVGETVRRATGRTVSAVLADDVAAPLGVPGELFFGVPAADLHRVAPLEDRDYASVLAFMSANVPHFDDVAPRGVWLDAALGNRRDILQADLPAVGTMTARAVARMFAALIGPVDGVRLISAERLRAATAVATSGPDWLLGQEAPTGLGYGVFAGGTVFGSSGNGGSLVYAEPALGLTVACTKTLLTAADGDPMEDLWALIRAAVARR